MAPLTRSSFGRRSTAVADSEDGIALLMVVIIMMVITVLLTTVFEIGMQTLPLARQQQDYQAALQAAEAGVQDYINRLDNNTTYYLTTIDSANAALENGTSWTTWAPVTGGGTNEWFRYAVNSQYAARTGVVYLKVSGAAGQDPSVSKHYSVRTIQVSLQLSGFTSFLYYTDYEIEDPNLVACFDESSSSCSRGSANGPDPYTNACVWHAWELNEYIKDKYGRIEYGPDPECGTTGNNAGCSYSSSSPYFSDCHIYFTSQDTLDGKLFSNDEFNICGAANFPQDVQSAYDQAVSLSSAGSTSYGGPGAYHPSSSSCGSPNFGASGTQPQSAGYSQFPATNTNMEGDVPVANDGGGCLYYGPVTIQFLADGNMIAHNTGSGTVSVPTGASYVCTSPYNQSTHSYTEIPIPPNGLLYDANETSCGSNCATSTFADASVSGTVGSASTDEQVTVGSQYDINITGNLIDYSTAGSDMIGLSAQHSILLPANGTSVTIDAAMVALKDSIYLPNWGGVGVQGTYTLLGSLAEEFRGPVGTFTTGWNGQTQIASGYAKSWSYDTRLRFLQPPYFTSPTLPDWTQQSFAECVGTATPSAPAVGGNATSC